MTLQDRLLLDLKESMRRGDTLRRSVIRYLRSAIQYEEKSKQRTLDDPGIIEVINRQVSQCRDSIDQFRKGDRQDLVEKELLELSILLEYLPKQMSQEEIADMARKTIQELGVSTPGEKGKVMAQLMPQVKGKAQGSEVSQIVSQMLDVMASNER